MQNLARIDGNVKLKSGENLFFFLWFLDCALDLQGHHWRY
jgi:hypothetical protein